MIKNLLKMFKSHFIGKKMTIYSPCSTDISNTADIIIDDKLLININWSKKLTIKNKIPCIIKLDDYSTLKVGKFLVYSGANIRVRNGAKLILNSGYINHNCIIDCTKEILIGNHVFIGENCMIRDSDNHILIRDKFSMSKSIIIDDNVWIGANSIILKGVHIHSGSVIAAGSVVTKDVPPNCIFGGNPAKIIRHDITWK